MYKEAGFKWRHDFLPKYVQSKQGGSFLISEELIINSDFYKWTTVELERDGAGMVPVEVGQVTNS